MTDASGGSWDRYLFRELALFGAVPAERTAIVFDMWLEDGFLPLEFPLAWWASAGDTVAIRSAACRERRAPACRAGAERQAYQNDQDCAAVHHLSIGHRRGSR